MDVDGLRMPSEEQRFGGTKYRTASLPATPLMAAAHPSERRRRERAPSRLSSSVEGTSDEVMVEMKTAVEQVEQQGT
jgi:hypothetical protein